MQLFDQFLRVRRHLEQGATRRNTLDHARGTQGHVLDRREAGKAGEHDVGLCPDLRWRIDPDSARCKLALCRFAYLGRSDPVFERLLDVRAHLVRLPHSDQRGDRDEAAIALREFRPFPEIAIDRARDQLEELRRHCANFAL
jgi:hypothetical protein